MCRTFHGAGAAVVTLFAFFSNLGQAQEVAEAEIAMTNQPALKVDIHRNIGETYVPYRYAFVTAGNEKYTFLVPEAYRVDTSDPEKIKLASVDYATLITISLVKDVPAGAKLDATATKARATTSCPEAVINEELTTCGNGQINPAIDYTWKTTSGITRKSRTTFVPVTGGLMEVSLTVSPDQFESRVSDLSLVLLTIRCGNNGKFDYVIGSKYP